MTTYLLETISFIFGMCIGSFLNVCIYRLPESKSIVYPSSTCPKCGQAIRPYDNIPALSYLWLRGRCRHCRTRIPFRYVSVEIMGGFLALCVFLKFGLSLEALVYFLFTAALMVVTFIDLDHQIIPDVITLPGIPLAFLASLALPSVKAWDSLLGILAGGGSLLAIGWLYHLITRKEGMGGGDIKLLAMIGALVGFKGVLFTIFVASAVGTIAGVLVMLRTQKDMKLAVPFGPFLSIGAVAYVFFGPELIAWYLNFLR